MTSKIFALLVLAVVSSAPLAKSSVTIKSEDDLKQLPLKDKLALGLVSKLGSQVVPKIPSSLFDFYDTSSSDLLFNDARLLLLQALSLDLTQPLMEVDYQQDFDLCIVDCFHLWVDIQIPNITMNGFETFISKAEVTPTTFSYNWHVGSWDWRSPGFFVNTTREAVASLFYDSAIGVKDFNLTITFNYGMVPDLGLQISNLTADVSITSMFYSLAKYVIIYAGEDPYEDGPFYADEGPEWVESWMQYTKADYENNFQFRINCVLSNGRVDPVECMRQDGLREDVRYYQMNVVQFFQAIVLGKLRLGS